MSSPRPTPGEEITDFVAGNPLFYSLSRPVLRSLAEKLQPQRFQPDQVIVREGELGDSFHVIREGHVHVVRSGEGRELVLAELGPGEGFGEMALMIDQPRSADFFADVMGMDELTALIRAHHEKNDGSGYPDGPDGGSGPVGALYGEG